MKDHEIIAILENCDESQRTRILAWARKRWPKKGPAASPAAPVLTERDRDMLRKILGAPQDRTIAQPPPWIPPVILTEPPRTTPPNLPGDPPDWTPDPGRPYKVTCRAVGGSVD